MTVTLPTYAALEYAYEFFNRELFSRSLPRVMVTFQRGKRFLGYFAPDQFSRRGEKATAHELAMNPDGFRGQTDEAILQTLVHEMCHVWQQAHGHPGRGKYHNREWAAKMLDIGLNPSHTGKPGGRMTGDHVSDYIIPDGSYQIAYRKLAKCGFNLRWETSAPAMVSGQVAKTKKLASKTKYSCLEHGLNFWGKPDTPPICPFCFPDARRMAVQQTRFSEVSAEEIDSGV